MLTVSQSTIAADGGAPSGHPVGIIGAGFIVAEVTLRSYRRRGVQVVAIASRHADRSAEVARRWAVPKSYGDPLALLDDEQVEVVEIAYPPHLQPGLVEEACRRDHIKAVLVQKPLSLSLEEAHRAVDCATKRGKTLAVNQNMRFDEALRFAKRLAVTRTFGNPVLAEVNMHAIPHWQRFLQGYGRLTIANMSVHHFDILRWLVGEPAEVMAQARPDPRTRFYHRDGIVSSLVRFENGALGRSLEDVWVGPTELISTSDASVTWRLTGELGLVEGSCGWPAWPNEVPSTLRYLAESTGGHWVEPRFRSSWFPDAFGNVMIELQSALNRGEEPENSGRDHLRTLAVVEAAYRSLDQKRAVTISEVYEQS